MEKRVEFPWVSMATSDEGEKAQFSRSYFPTAINFLNSSIDCGCNHCFMFGLSILSVYLLMSGFFFFVFFLLSLTGLRCLIMWR